MKKYKNNMLFAGGSVLLIVGVGMVLAFWPDVVSFFKGFAGIVFAVCGLMMMHAKKN